MSDLAIYQIQHIASGKVYVGSTNNWPRRLAEHKAELRGDRHCNAHLQRAWNKHGEPEFVFSVLENLQAINRLVEREQRWIDELGAAISGYNMCPAAGTTRGLPCSDEKKAKISAANTGRVYSEVAKQRIRDARAKQTIIPESIAKTRAANTGLKRTAEFRAHVSACLAGVTRSAETRAKLAAANIGKKASAETRAKMSESAKAARARRKLSQGALHASPQLLTDEADGGDADDDSAVS